MTGIKSRPESLPQGVLLAIVGGYLDAYTYVGHRVFANAQTGNVVLFGVDVAAAHWHDAVSRLVPIAAFLLGVLAVETLGLPRVRQAVRRPLRLALSIQIVVLAVVASFPDNAPAALVTVPVAFVAAIQFATFRVLGDMPYTTLLASGNLRVSTAAAYRWVRTREPAAQRQAAWFGAVIGAFTLGAVCGGLFTRHLGTSAIAVASGLLLVALILMISETKQLTRRAAMQPPSPSKSTPTTDVS